MSTIITHRQFPNYKKYEIMYEGRPLSMEVGKMAELCNAAVLVKLRRDHRAGDLHRLPPSRRTAWIISP
jgi:hypothetical protein